MLGKTGLRSYVESNFEGKDGNKSHVSIDPDQIAMFHKNYKIIINQFPDDSYSLLQEFVRPCLDNYIRSKAVELNVNLFQEGTLASDAYIDIIDFQKNGGIARIGKRDQNLNRADVNVKGDYNIEIDVLAVHRYESLLSSYEREFSFIENGLPPRAVIAKNHDYSYNKMLENLRKIENKNLADNIRVFKRGDVENHPILIYETGDKTYKDSVEAIEAEREKGRKELLKNPEKYYTRINELKKRIADRIRIKGDFGNSDILINKINDLEKEFTLDLEKENKKGVNK